MSDRTVSLLILLAACFCLSVFFFITEHYFVDDAYIGFRYITNFLSGNGFVFNPGERVEGITNIGWLLFITPLACFLEVPLCAKLVGYFCDIGTLCVLALLAQRLAPTFFANPGYRLFAFPIPMFAATNFSFNYFSLAGLETGFLALLLSLITLWTSRYPLNTYLVVLASLTYVVRPECALIAPLLILISWIASSISLRKAAESLSLWLLTLAIITLVRYSYFGDILPNTFYAKSSPFLKIGASLVRTFDGSYPNVPGLISGLMGLFAAGCGLCYLWRRVPSIGIGCICAFVTGLVFAIYSRADWTGTDRYFAPYYPLAIIVFWSGAVYIVRATASGVIGHKATHMLIYCMAGAVVVINLGISVFNLRNIHKAPAMASESLIVPSMWMGRFCEPSSIIACGRIGTVGYFSGRNIFDFSFGLTNRSVARARRENGGKPFDINDPALAEAWHKVNPQYVLVPPGMSDECNTTCDIFFGTQYCLVHKWKIAEQETWFLYERRPDFRADP
jgi:arabinofuranosyltransferase